MDPGASSLIPGSLAAQAIEDAISEGATELDLLVGAEAYKLRWGAAEERTSRLRLGLQNARQHRAERPTNS